MFLRSIASRLSLVFHRIKQPELSIKPELYLTVCLNYELFPIFS